MIGIMSSIKTVQQKIITTTEDKGMALMPKKPLNNRVAIIQMIIPIISTGKVLYQKSFPKTLPLKTFTNY